ncbi:MAG: hypothetical protein E5V67_01905 [Mesorhizobium sp.]|uniref:hypothetical protein n=1 Tax=unclassified Mesorhizobium TaxID=325217 RepID=UPI000FDA025B|nr:MULTISPECIES: hypothetical protein [unclassified Mesorhizobium]TGV94520.1 hypothetical protein EN801_002500 [Mesorhizobium sp. M00.F.Ca.ET.158.01.1.1]TIU86512.1 MAG: hypothetical protein E5W06_09295 [Mesorhizobium sp.]TGQ20027.1 hypothetical protein EN860_014860 [Mesorhizobium sp. M00.F.Ca.ET.217.01.1.1]TGS69157.1 hypothetical protein EN844_09830 [Mesorhizobium sp. M3A.F.Ca.ET.201.01.1.1]TKB44468.1 MAG: hypothetical protein E5V67_01905 [Mesorhizobium sp.]
MKTVLSTLSLVVGTTTANATDALPIADGAYMRSADYCEQFRQGKLDFIEFSVSKGGHYYEFPESGCVVATVKLLRTNRYAVDADCMEGGEHSQQSFILDVEGARSVRIDGMKLTSCDVTAPTEKKASREVPLPSFSARRSQGPSPAGAKKATPPTKLIRQWQVANENCRGGSGDDPQTEKACNARDALARRLEAAKWCYGKNGQSGYQYRWHRCGKGSIHF